MTLYIKMPQAPGLDYGIFRARYLELTGEKIQDTPLENEQGTHYLVGSSRLSQAIADQLVSEFPAVTIGQDMPVGWLTKQEEL